MGGRVSGTGLRGGGLGGVEPGTSQMKVSQSSDWKLKKKNQTYSTQAP